MVGQASLPVLLQNMNQFHSTTFPKFNYKLIIKSRRIFISAKFLLVDKIKRIALANFHRSKWGEVLILKLYLKSEELAASNGYFSLDEILTNSPDWLQIEMRRHEKEEQGHVRALENRISSMAAVERNIPLYFLSNSKIKKFHLLAKEYENKFASGLIVPALVVGLILENLGVRIFKRHMRVLQRIDSKSPTYLLLASLIKDEKRHMQGFLKSLRKLIQPNEFQDYRALRKRALSLDQKGGLRSAIGMLVLSLIPIRALLPSK
jgi:hypothetical protein